MNMSSQLWRPMYALWIPVLIVSMLPTSRRGRINSGRDGGRAQRPP